MNKVEFSISSSGNKTMVRKLRAEFSVSGPNNPDSL